MQLIAPVLGADAVAVVVAGRQGVFRLGRRDMLDAPELQKQLVEMICAYLSGAGRTA